MYETSLTDAGKRNRPWIDLDEAIAFGYRSSARAAIEAMREPTKAMCDAVDPNKVVDWSLEPGEGVDGYNFDAAWRSMIDAALQEPPSAA